MMPYPWLSFCIFLKKNISFRYTMDNDVKVFILRGEALNYMRRRFISVLLLLILLITPVFANTDWTESKTLGNIPHEEITYPYLSSVSKGTLERRTLPYPANLEVAIEYDADDVHSLRYTLYLYEKNIYVPVTLTSRNKVTVTLTDDEENSINLNITDRFADNRIGFDELQSLAFTEMMMGSDYVDIKIVDRKDVYTFRVDTRKYARRISSMLLSEGATELDIHILNNEECNIASFVARSMKKAVSDPAVSTESVDSLIKFLIENSEDELMMRVADVLWSLDYEGWIEYFDSDDTDKANEVLHLIDVEYIAPMIEKPSAVVETPVFEPAAEEVPEVEEKVVAPVEAEVVPEPVVEEVVPEAAVEEEVASEAVEEEVEEDPDRMVVKELVIEKLYIGDKEITADYFQTPEENVFDADEIVDVELPNENEPEMEEELPPEIEDDIDRHFFISAKTYGMGANLTFGGEETPLTMPLGGALDFTYVGGKHGVSIEAAYVYQKEAHTFEPGISYIYRLQNNDKIEVDSRFGVIANIRPLDGNVIGYSFGGRLGIEMNFFMTPKAFFNFGLHVRGLSPVIIFNEGVNAGSEWDLDFELGAGFGIAF